jgi:hypothetical protein
MGILKQNTSRKAKIFLYVWAKLPRQQAGMINIARGLFLKRCSLYFLIFGSPIPFRQKSPRRRSNSLGGASRRPANSGMGAYLQNCSNLFYQKLLKNVSSGSGGRKRG